MNITLTSDNLELIKKYETIGDVAEWKPFSVLEDFPKTEVLVTTRFDPIDIKILNWMKRLKVVAFPGTGLDHIDMEECEKRGIKVISLKGETEFLSGIPSVSEMTLWFMLELLRRPHDGRYLGNQLKDKCVAVWGMGRIGTQVYHRASAFDAFVIGGDKDEGMSMGELITLADIFTIHVPLNSETEGMITEEHLRMMKHTAFLINTSRSQLIQEGAIEKAIREKWIAGYGTDVVRNDEEFQRLEQLQKEGYNVVLTRHICGNTAEAREQTDNFIFLKVKEYVESKP